MSDELADDVAAIDRVLSLIPGSATNAREELLRLKALFEVGLAPSSEPETGSPIASIEGYGQPRAVLQAELAILRRTGGPGDAQRVADLERLVANLEGRDTSFTTIRGFGGAEQ